MFHRWLPASTATELLTDLLASGSLLEQLVGIPVSGLAYPTGGWNRRVRRAARASGYDDAVTVDRGINPAGRSNLLSLRRSFVPDDAEDLEILLNGGYDHLRFGRQCPSEGRQGRLVTRTGESRRCASSSC